MTIFTDITKAFDLPLKTFGTTNSIKVCLENINCPTSTDNPYLASFMLLAPTEQADLSISEFRQGLYQVDIRYASHVGSAPINKMADLLNATFKTGSCFEFNGICLCIQSVDLSQLIVENGWGKRSLSINFNTYTPRL